MKEERRMQGAREKPGAGRRRRWRGAVLALCMAVLVCAMAVPAAGISPTPTRVTDKNTQALPGVPVALEAAGMFLTGRIVDGVTLLGVRDFYTAYCNVSITYNAKTRTATVRTEGLEAVFTDGSYVVYANGRCLYSDVPVTILSDGRMMAPVRVLAKTLSLAVTWDGTARRVTLAGEAEPLMRGEDYYDADVLYWLSRIISAESGTEPLVGQIAVGNVVLNRVRNAEFPNTVWGVIFDRKNGVQFTPVANGTVYDTPLAASVTAARICMEGETVSTDILYFFDPDLSTSFWIAYNRPYAFTILHHRFYK